MYKSRWGYESYDFSLSGNSLDVAVAYRSQMSHLMASSNHPNRPLCFSMILSRGKLEILPVFEAFKQIPKKWPSSNGLHVFKRPRFNKPFMYRNDSRPRKHVGKKWAYNSYQFHVGLRKFVSTGKWGHTVIFGPAPDIFKELVEIGEGIFTAKHFLKEILHGNVAAQHKTMRFLKISMDISVRNILKCREYVEYTYTHMYVYMQRCKWHETIKLL